MSTFWEDDVAIFLNDFATDAGIGDDETIKVIFTNTFELTLDAENNMPVAICASSDASGMKQGDVITIENIDFEIVGIHMGNDGTTQLFLSIAPVEEEPGGSE